MESDLDILPAREGQPNDRIDAAAVVGQFLRDLDLADLVVELVQNELDAGSTRTVINFGDRALTCEGDGRPFDRKGWLRLESVLGAGGDVKAKKDGIGSKNHGLRSAFLLADRIGVQSSGLRADLTVTGDTKRLDRFKPAFWPRTPDVDAPAHGTRITAPYRKRRLRRPDGDATYLEPPTPAELDALWRDAVDAAPERFLTASTPGVAWSYTLVLSRAGQETCELAFASAPLSGSLRGLWLRTCKTRPKGKPLATVARRHTLRFPVKVVDGGKVPRLFRSGSQLFGELSWPVSRAGRPQRSRGGLRYPIAFPEGDARSGHAFDISAPFIAGRARHSLSSDARNTELLKAGREAMAAAGPRLSRAYGPAVGQLVQSQDPHEGDQPLEQALIEGWLDSGGLSVATFAKGFLPAVTGSAPSTAGASVILARPSRGGTLTATLCALAVGQCGVVSPEFDPIVLDTLARLARAGDARVQLFGESDAARSVFIDGLHENAGLEPGDLPRVAAALDCLDALRLSGGLPSPLVAELMSKGALPGESGVALAWSRARQSRHALPQIPGVTAPPVVEPTLLRSPVLRRGTLELKRFDLNDFIGGLNFARVIDAGRLSFFDWLRENAPTLKAAALRRIADYPIWPGADGAFRPLDAYCRPKTRRLQEILGDALATPSAAVIALATSKRLPPKSLRLRSDPSSAELRDWHARAMQSVENEADPKARMLRLDRLEADLDWLRQREQDLVAAMAGSHRTLSQLGELQPVRSLHVPNATTVACALSPKTMTRTKRAALYEALGAKRKPEPAAIVAALREDPDWSKLFIRLEAYRHSGLDLGTLSSEPIIPCGNGPVAGDTLAFAGEPDVWGTWKARLTAGDVAQQHALLAQLGVVRAKPTRDTSLAFFRWLATQPRALQRDHHAQVARHWRDTLAGPPAWARAHPDVPCLPVTGRGQAFALVSPKDADTPRQDIYLDDFPELRDAVLKDGKARLTLAKAPGTQFSGLDAFRSLGVASLRRAVGAPRSIQVGTGVRPADDVEAELNHLKSGAVLAALKTRLPLHGVSVSDLRPEWQKLVKGIKGIRISKSLTAVYRFLRSDYEVSTAGGIDTASDLLCLSADSDRMNEFYAVLAEHLFRAGKGEASAWGLMRAARDRRQLSLFGAEDDLGEPDDGSAEEEQEGGDVHGGHGLSAAKLTPVVPNPGPLADISDVTQLSGRKIPRKARRTPIPADKRNSVEEEEQKLRLKHDHYGYHCQACLGEMEVLRAAPPGTYVFAPGYRQRLIQAHHAHQMQNQGILGGKNLLVLCEFHHRLWGDHLSRERVLAALATASPIRRHFPTDADGVHLQARDGLLAEVALDIAPLKARLYFTQLHANAWRGTG